MKFLYLLIDLFAVILPLIYSFHPKINFHTEWKWVFPAIAISAFIFILWDMIFTNLGAWHFNPNYITGIYINNLPLEEMLFFICIPFSCIFTYYCMNNFLKLTWKPGVENPFVVLSSFLLIVISFLYWQRIYTRVAFLSTGLLCLYLKFFRRIKWFSKLVYVYLVLLIPFFIVNGLLTGTLLKEPVVIYNPDAILGFRVLSIPIEDFIYGFELILVNLSILSFFAEPASAKNFP